MPAVVLTVHLLLALALILVVLMQRSEGGGLGIGGGGGIMTSRGAATALSKVTWALGAAFIATSLWLTILAAQESGRGSVIDGASAPTAPAPAPGLEGDLLPPVPAPAATPAPAPAPAADGPAAPPPVE